MFRQQISSKVYHEGKEWSISNWANGDYVNLSRGNDFANGIQGEYKSRVPQNEIVNSCKPSEYVHRFSMMYHWYMSCWLRIEVEKRLYKRI